MESGYDITDTEYDELLRVRTSGEMGMLSREAINEYNRSIKRKITQSELQALLDGEDITRAPDEVEIDVYANRGDDEGKDNRRRAKTNHFELMANFILDEIEKNPSAPFGIHTINNADWAALAQDIEANPISGHREKKTVPGVYLTHYLCGIMAAQNSVHPHTRAAINRKFFFRTAHEKVVDLTPAVFDALVLERIEDKALNFEQTIRFMMGARNLKHIDIERAANITNLSEVLSSEPNRLSAPSIAKLLSPINPLHLPLDKNEPGKVSAEVSNIIWSKTRGRDGVLGAPKIYPLISQSEQLLTVAIEGVKTAVENYEAGRCSKAELPTTNEIINMLIKLSPRLERGDGMHAELARAGMKIPFERFRGLMNPNPAAPKYEELLDLCQALKLPEPEDMAKLLMKLPCKGNVHFNLRHPTYIVKHPEHYQTLGSWLEALRKSCNYGAAELGQLLGKDEYSNTIIGLEQRKNGHDFKKYGSGSNILESILDTNPYGCFPVDEQGKVTQAFRERFWQLAKPGVMKNQYEDAQQWITQSQLLRELGLKTDRPLLQEILHYWHQDTKELQCDCRGSIQQGIYTLDVKRDEEGELRFHKSTIDILKSDPDIQSHMGRQQQSQPTRH